MSPRGLVVRALAVLLVLGAAVTTLVVAVVYERAFWPDCPRYTVEASARTWWARDRMGCPAGDTTVSAAGLRYTPWAIAERFTGHWQYYALYDSPDGPVLLPMDVYAVWLAEGGPHGRLGQPDEGGGNDRVYYVNFHGGAIVVPVGSAPEVHTGQSYDPAREPGSACVPHDRPCITAAYADAEGVHLRWQFGPADAFNVGWWPRGERGLGTFREVAGYEFTVPDLRPGTVYVLEVAACRKRFLRRSVCTLTSTPVTVRVG